MHPTLERVSAPSFKSHPHPQRGAALLILRCGRAAGASGVRFGTGENPTGRTEYDGVAPCRQDLSFYGPTRLAAVWTHPLRINDRFGSRRSRRDFTSLSTRHCVTGSSRLFFQSGVHATHVPGGVLNTCVSFISAANWL
jgi:hypothetical protein